MILVVDYNVSINTNIKGCEER